MRPELPSNGSRSSSVSFMDVGTVTLGLRMQNYTNEANAVKVTIDKMSLDYLLLLPLS